MATEDNDKTAAEMVGEKKDEVKEEVATDLAKEAVAQQARMDTGTTSDAEPTGTKWQGSDEMNLYSHLLDGGIEALKKVIDKKDGIPEEKVAGLLILERNGQNRTEFVKLLMKRLGIKDIRKELPQAGGPDYTNDTTNLTDL